MAGTAVSRPLGMLSSIVIARILGKVGFGEMGIIQGTVGMFGTFAGFGMGLTATKYVAEFRLNDPARAGRVIGLSSSLTWVASAIMALTLVLLAPWLCENTLAAPHLTNYLKAGSLILLFSGVNGAQMGTLSGFEAFKSIGYINSIAGIITVPLTVAGVWIFGLWGLVFGLAGTQAASCLMCFYAVRREAARHKVPISFRNCTDELPIAWNFSVPALLSGLVLSPVNWACIAMLVNRPGGYGEMGIYNAASQWRTMLFFLPSILMQAVLPVMSSARASLRGTGDFEDSLRFTQSAMIMVGFPVCTLVMAMAHWIMPAYGSDFSSGAGALVGAALATLIQCIGAAGGPAIESKGKMWLALAINLSYSGFFLAGALILVPISGASGLLFASALAYIAITIWTYTYIRCELPSGMFRRVIMSTCFAIVLAGICLLASQRFSYILAMPLILGAAVVSFQFLVDPKVRQAIFSFLQKGHLDVRTQ